MTMTTPTGTGIAKMTQTDLVPVVETSTAAAAQMARSAIESRFTMAMAYPRDWTKVRAQIVEACQRPRFAEEARYKLPRGTRDIEGLSVRFAEEAARALGNLLIEANVVFDDTERRVVRVSATDLEGNVTWPFDVVIEKTVERRGKGDREVVSRRTNSEGIAVYRVLATDDEVLMKQNSLVSKAARNGILRFLPSDVQEDALALIHKTLTAKVSDQQTVTRLATALERLGVSQEQVEGYLGHAMDKITALEYSTLRGYHEALKDGETTWEDVTRSVPKTTRRKTETTLPEVDYATGEVVAKDAATPTPTPEVIDMAAKTTVVEPLPAKRRTTDADPYHCAHGVKLDMHCIECAYLNLPRTGNDDIGSGY